jgi:hypothetical protein
VITYFILIKGAKGTSFLSPETISWIKTHAWTILGISFLFFGVLFQLLSLLTRINILKPIVLIGTFALAMAFAANDLVNFIGVPLAGLSAYQVASTSPQPLTATMAALQESVQTNTLLLLIAGAIMMVTLWLSRKARTVTQTGISLGRQDEGIERFGSTIMSRTIVRMVYATLVFIKKFIPVSVKARFSQRLDPASFRPVPGPDGKFPSFDLVRASVNLIVASAIISFATSLKLPLSTTYVTFMVAMGTSLSDQAWGRESAVYRITGVLTVIGGWFFTALAAFTGALIVAIIINFLKLPAILCLLILAGALILSTRRYHLRKEKETGEIEAFSLKKIEAPDAAIRISFEQTGKFLKSISDNLGQCIEAAISEDRERLKGAKNRADQFEKRAGVIVENTFKTLLLLHKSDLENTQRYSFTIKSLQAIAQSHRDIVTQTSEHFENYHTGFVEEQKEELRHIKTFLNRLLWNTSIMLLRRKKVDYDYIENQCEKIRGLISEYEKNQIIRIQHLETKTRLSILFYGLLVNCLKISEETKNLLDLFKVSFDPHQSS